VGELSKSHAKKLIVTGKAFYSVVPVVPINTFVEAVHRQIVNELGKNRSAFVHRKTSWLSTKRGSIIPTNGLLRPAAANPLKPLTGKEFAAIFRKFRS